MSSKRGNVSSRRAGIAALAAVSLGVGAVVVPQAIAADGIGYDKNTAVVELSQQKATDLNAGTCSFELSDQE